MECGTDQPVPCAPDPEEPSDPPPPPPPGELFESLEDWLCNGGCDWEELPRFLDAIPGEGAAVKIGGSYLSAILVTKLGRQSGPFFKTTKEAAKAAEALGFKKVNETVHGGQAVFQRGKLFITRDLDGHNGGAWKVARSVSDLESKAKRMGTFDASLTKFIGR